MKRIFCFLMFCFLFIFNLYASDTNNFPSFGVFSSDYSSIRRDIYKIGKIKYLNGEFLIDVVYEYDLEGNFLDKGILITFISYNSEKETYFQANFAAIENFLKDFDEFIACINNTIKDSKKEKSYSIITLNTFSNLFIIRVKISEKLEGEVILNWNYFYFSNINVIYDLKNLITNALTFLNSNNN